MFAIAIFGGVMVAISFVMIARPKLWGQTIVRFTRMPYMHPFEILTRIGFGVLFVLYADHSKFPAVISLIGYVLLAVGLGLLVTPPKYHRRFAVWCVERFANYFRPAGIASLVFGVFLIYAAV